VNSLKITPIKKLDVWSKLTKQPITMCGAKKLREREREREGTHEEFVYSVRSNTYLLWTL